MNYLKRRIPNSIIQNLQPNEVVVLLGSQRTGKTVLNNTILNQLAENHLLLNGDDLTTFSLLKLKTLKVNMWICE